MAKLSEHDKTHMRNLAAIRKRVDRIFAEAAREAARIGVKVKEPLAEDRIFSFDDYPATLREVEALVGELREQVEVAIVNGVRSAWTLSNNKNNALVSRVFAGRERDLSEEEYRRYFSNNNSALEAFLRRRTQGMDLSDRVWNYGMSFRREIEMGIDLGLRSGESAAQMARSLRQYLRAPDKLFRRVRDRHGVLQLSKAAGAYHPGRGVYRSSYKNALRLAATETNMAYRTADHLRWQQMDFVVGIEIRLSNNHTLNGARFTDICDTLAGRYPKDFKFTGWHPLCRCHAVTVLKTEAEMAEDTRRILAGEAPVAGSVNAVREVPAAFREWVDGNAERISAARQRGTLPYFLRDNGGYLGGSGSAGSGSAGRKSAGAGGGGAAGDKGGIVEKRERERIEANRKEYERLRIDPNYTDVVFNPENGGLKATHVDHEKHDNVKNKRLFFGNKTPWDLEKECQDILYQNGFSCILNSEHIFDPNTGNQLKVLDSTINGTQSDIASITENGKNTIRSAVGKKKKQIREVNQRTGMQYATLILHFHEPSYYNEETVKKQIGGTFKQIIVVLNTSPGSVIVIK